MRSMVEGAQDSPRSPRFKVIAAATFIALLWQRSSVSGAPSPAIAGADDFHPANAPQFFARFSAPRSDRAKIV